MQPNAGERTGFFPCFKMKHDRRRDLVAAWTDCPAFPVVVAVRPIRLRFFRRNVFETAGYLTLDFACDGADSTGIIDCGTADLEALYPGVAVVDADSDTGDE